jgi:Lrp/AsnC family transcriptional regulator, leucine-responsive regulatory protein
MAETLDSIDLSILAELQKDASVPNAELAKKIGMAPSAILERVKKLKQKGAITELTAHVHPDHIDLKLLAFIFIKSSEGPGNISVAKQLSKLPEVLELHHIAGEDCYLVKVRARDPQSLAQLMRDKFSKVPGLLSTKTTIVLETMKESTHLPIPKSL